MIDLKMKVNSYLYNLMTNSIVYNYNKDFSKFYSLNSTIRSFLNNHSKYIPDINSYNIIVNNITEQDYQQLLNYYRLEYDKTKPKKLDFVVRAIIPNKDISFIPLSELNVEILSEENKKIYDEAITLSNRKMCGNDISIGVKNDCFVRMIKDENNNVKCWVVNANDKVLLNKENKPIKVKKLENKRKLNFSNAIIFAFVVGSFIGIVFLCIYSKLMN